MRSMEMSAKTVEDAVQAACDALGVDRDDINVSYEVLEFPARKLFKTIPAKVLVKVEEPEAEVAAPVETAVAAAVPAAAGSVITALTPEKAAPAALDKAPAAAPENTAEKDVPDTPKND